MTFTFREAKPVRLMVPVKTRTGHFANLPSAPAGPPASAPPVTAPPTGSPSPTG
ncbi:hypothetical protein ACFQQB_41710 [Nonomuraea rubra]